MFNNLIETNAKKQRSEGGTLMSLVLHSGLIVLAVVATANAGEQLPTEKPEKVDFVEPPRQEEPPPSEAAAALPPEAIAAPPLPKGFQVLQPPMDIPSVIPPIDLSKNGIDERDFTARGVRGGTDDGIVGVEAPRVVDAGATYLDTQVDRAVVQLPGRGSPSYPSMLQSQGVKGRVVAQFVVDTTGRADVSTFRVLESSHELFSKSVERALSEMRFVPAEVRGQKVKQLVQQPFVFDIR